jgi:hypothetical protein
MAACQGEAAFDDHLPYAMSFRRIGKAVPAICDRVAGRRKES